MVAVVDPVDFDCFVVAFFTDVDDINEIQIKTKFRDIEILEKILSRIPYYLFSAAFFNESFSRNL